MLFKNAIIYRLHDQFPCHTAEALSDKLADLAYEPAGAYETKRRGWINPVKPYREADSVLAHQANGAILIKLCIEEKLLPAAVINDELNERIAQIEESEARKVARKEKTELKERITLDLLPKALSKFKTIRAYIDTKEGYLVVDSGTFSAAEDLIDTLRETLGTLPASPVGTTHNPSQVMTTWLNQEQAPAPFVFGQKVKLADATNEAAFKAQDLHSDEIKACLQNGKQVTELALIYDEKISLTLTDDLRVKAAAFTDIFDMGEDYQDAEDAAMMLDTELAIMVGEMRPLLRNLTEAFGGEDRREADAA